MQRFFILFLAIMSASFFSSCKASEQSASEKFSNALVVASGATDVKFSKYHGTDQVAYKRRTDFPASAVIEEITAEMEKRGWQPLKEDFLNPGMPTSMVNGWSEVSDATKHPTMTLHMWMTDWSNNKGEIVSYALRYQYLEGKEKDLKNLNVNAIYIPASLVKEEQKAINAYRSKRKN